MRFQVPQFIDVEDKIFGPFTLKQFIYLAGGTSVAVVSVTFLGIFFGLLVASPIIILSIALAFYKINNRPFIHTVESAFKYFTKDKLYIWKKAPREEQELGVKETKYTSLVVPSLSKSKLKDLNWQLDVKKGEKENISN